MPRRFPALWTAKQIPGGVSLGGRPFMLGSSVQTLWPVIVGGVIGIAGGVIGPGLLYWLQSKDDKKKHLAQKFEEMVAAVYGHDHWLDAQRDHRLFKGAAPDRVAPLRKVQAISTVYFPAFEPSISRFEDAARSYELWMLATARKRLDDPQASLSEGHDEAYSSYGREREALLSDLEEYARRHFR